MPTQSSTSASHVKQLEDHLSANRYSAQVSRHYLWIAKRFIAYLETKSLEMDVVHVRELELFLQWELRNWRRRHGRTPRNLFEWRRRYTTALNTFLRFVRGHWPILPPPATTIEAFHRELALGYDKWMQELRGLACVTRSARTRYALEFLAALGSKGDPDGIAQLSVHDLDGYLQQRCKGLSRKTIQGYTTCFRSFLRYLYGIGRMTVELSRSVMGPRIYDYENIPSALRPEEVQGVLEVTRHDSSPAGLRDYALLMLLATYGMRAGEVIALRLDHIDWKRDTLLVVHSKTGAVSELPLLPEPGEAVLRYLEKARPESKHPEVFLLMTAPYRPYKRASILNCIIARRLREAGITPLSRKGAHAFRHARAVSLLRAAVPLKTIGDVLGHKSAKATATYLKLATEDLRSVGLNIPKEILP